MTAFTTNQRGVFRLPFPSSQRGTYAIKTFRPSQRGRFAIYEGFTTTQRGICRIGLGSLYKRGKFRVITSLSNKQRGSYRTQLLSVEGYTAYVGVNGPPDLTLTPTFSATLPFNIPITPGGSSENLNIVVRKRNAYGLESTNQNPIIIRIDNAGNQLPTPVPTPYGLITVSPTPGTIRVLAKYPNLPIDLSPANTWNVWINTVAPNVLVDVPTIQVLVNGSDFKVDLTGYTPGTLYYIAVCLLRASDSTQSLSITTTFTPPAIPTKPTAIPSGFQY